jgi:hypothetical protein
VVVVSIVPESSLVFVVSLMLEVDLSKDVKVLFFLSPMSLLFPLLVSFPDEIHPFFWKLPLLLFP